jgi:hypothetical protein
MEEEFIDLISEHHMRRPLMRAADWYKLLYQGVFSVGHIMGEASYGRLVEETRRVRDLGPQGEPLIEKVSPDGAVVRVNLRPYARRGGSLEALYEAMLASSSVKGDPKHFIRLWRRFERVAEELHLGVDEREICELDDLLADRGPVPMHHTQEYREAYYPAYRVVILRELDRVLGRSLASD